MTSSEGAAPPLAVFIHIPKTAGTSLRSAIRRQYGASAVLYNNASILDHEHQSALAQAALAAGRRLTAVSGHFLPGIHAAVGRSDARYITLLRDPVDRVLSHYHHIRRNDTPHIVINDDDLAQWLSTSTASNNLQTRVLAARFGAPVPLADDDALARAKATLEGFAVIGLTERFADSLLLIAERLDWRFPKYRKQNVNPAGRISWPIAEEIRNQAATYNRLDLELYKWACEQFESELAARGFPERVRAAAFPVANRARSVIGDTRKLIRRHTGRRVGG